MGARAHAGDTADTPCLALDFDGYAAFEVVGRGGFGTVYRARKPGSHRVVAIKVFETTRPSPDWAVRYAVECDRLRGLSERAQIVTVLDGGVLPNGAPYLVSELMAGGSLSSRLERGGRLPNGEILAIALELAAALQSAHEAGVVHRAVKPANVLMSRFGHPQLADFVPALLAPDYERSARRSASDAAFVAPEVRNGGSSSPSTDIYGLAATVATMLSGGSVDFSTTAMRASGPSVELKLVLHKALSDTSRARYASMEEFRAALADVPGARTIWRWVRVPVPRSEPQAATELAAGDPADGGPGQASGYRKGRPWRRSGLALLVVAVVALAATGAYKAMHSSSAAASSPPRPQVLPVSLPKVVSVAPPLRSTCLGYTCQFTDHGGTLPAGTRLHWDFGDGHAQATRSGQVSHTYAKSGPYVVVVTESDDGTTGLSNGLPVALSSWSRTAQLTGHGRGSLLVTLAVASSQSACRAAPYVLQRSEAGSWVTVGSGTVAATGSSFTAPHFGTYRAVVSESATKNGECGSGTTGPVRLRHRPAPPVIQPPTVNTPPPAPRPQPPAPKPKPTPTPTHKVVPTPTFGPPP
ncbi:MAG TPA: protein kinase [Mycobacteriales bacterium]|nr:protein kinase [Mycobacteriales bacterium]